MQGDLIKKIENPKEYEIVEFDGVTHSTVYRHGLSMLERETRLLWRLLNDESFMEIKGLTLDEIRNQMLDVGIITIFVESPTHTEILQYGNYGDEWWQIGETMGYA